jgi:hypothetical protein
VTALAPPQTAWGALISHRVLAPGILEVECLNGYGIWLTPERNSAVPAVLRSPSGLYEGERAFAVPVLVHARSIEPERPEFGFSRVRSARHLLADLWPEALTVIRAALSPNTVPSIGDCFDTF